MEISDWRMSMSFWKGLSMNNGSRDSEEVAIASNTRVLTPKYGTSTIRMVVEIKSSKKFDSRTKNRRRKTMKNLNSSHRHKKI